MSVTTPWPHIWNSRLTPPVSGITPWVASGSMKRASSEQMRMSQSSARWNEPPMAQPWMATMTGASTSNSRRMPLWPRVMSWWWVSSVVFVPIADTSRPDDHEWPSPRQMTARRSGIDSSSARMSKSWASISSVNALRFSGLSLVIVAMLPSTSSLTWPLICSPRCV